MEKIIRQTLELGIISIVLLTGGLAQAGWEEGVKAMPEGQPALCEHLLTPKQIHRRESELVRNFFGRPFVIYNVLKMKAAGMQKFGFKVDVNDSDLNNLVLLSAPASDGNSLQIRLGLFRGFKFVNLLEFGLRNPQVIGWSPVQVNKSQTSLPYEKLIHEFPPLGEGRDAQAGYHSAPDGDGVRRYIAYSDGGTDVAGIVTLGIDVPCDQIDTYTSDSSDFIDTVYAPNRNYCRISFLSFARTD